MRVDVHSGGEDNGMSMDTIVVVLVVAFALLFIGRRAVSKVRGGKPKGGGGGGCEGCG